MTTLIKQHVDLLNDYLDLRTEEENLKIYMQGVEQRHKKSVERLTAKERGLVHLVDNARSRRCFVLRGWVITVKQVRSHDDIDCDVTVDKAEAL